MARKYLSEVVSLENPFEGIFTVALRPLEHPYKFSPGQFLHLALDKEYDGSGQWPESRCFSMQSNPKEDLIRITYSVKGPFTKKMENHLKVHSEVWLKLPYGDLFEQNHSKKNTVFIAGGTGVTPFLSLFTDESFRNYEQPKIYLGFRSMAFNIYQKELDSICNKTSIISVKYQDTEGILDIDAIFRENGMENSYFISGPPIMIGAFKQYLLAKGVPKSAILTDDWE